MVYDHSQEAGAHNTPSAELGNEVLAHVKGKYGELLIGRWLIHEKLLPSHTPFRNDYSRKVDEDDYIVNGVTIEVKAKQRGSSSPFPPRLSYNVNMGRRGLEHDIYVFVEIDPQKLISEDPDGMILGWATPERVRSVGSEIIPGATSDNGRFTFKRYDWDIRIGALYKAADLPAALTGTRRIPLPPVL